MRELFWADLAENCQNVSFNHYYLTWYIKQLSLISLISLRLLLLIWFRIRGWFVEHCTLLLCQVQNQSSTNSPQDLNSDISLLNCGLVVNTLNPEMRLEDEIKDCPYYNNVIYESGHTFSAA